MELASLAALPPTHGWTDRRGAVVPTHNDTPHTFDITP
jgi:hypothetical protein